MSDDAGFERSCAQGRALGFDGKTLIHPKTLGVANRAFTPSPAEVEHARRVVAAFEAAAAAGSALVVLDGRLVEELHVRMAKWLIALSEAIGAAKHCAHTYGTFTPPQIGERLSARFALRWQRNTHTHASLGGSGEGRHRAFFKRQCTEVATRRCPPAISSQ